jgi:hypothetical protein
MIFGKIVVAGSVVGIDGAFDICLGPIVFLLPDVVERF